MTLQIKDGVRLSRLTPQMALAAAVVYSVYQRNGADCTITSANDSTHSPASFHYDGRALDFRTKSYASSKLLLVEEIKKALGPEFDVILESPGGNNEHVHVEFDPPS